MEHSSSSPPPPHDSLQAPLCYTRRAEPFDFSLLVPHSQMLLLLHPTRG